MSQNDDYFRYREKMVKFANIYRDSKTDTERLNVDKCVESFLGDENIIKDEVNAYRAMYSAYKMGEMA